MSIELNLDGKLDFSEIDLTAPNIVIEEILSQLPKETNNLVLGEISSYSGHVTSYRKKGLSSIALSLGQLDEEYDIQDDLGKIGAEIFKYECNLYPAEYEEYRYRIFFIKFNDSNYPATVVVEESIARSLPDFGTGYIFTCNTRNDLEKLVVNILTSKRVVSVMQELIRVNQAKKALKTADTEDATVESESE